MLALLVLVSWWCVSGVDGSLRRVQAAGALRIGYAVEAPYALTHADGSAGGESPAVAAAAAHALGVRPVFVLMDFAHLIPALEARRIDVIAAGLFVTPQRAARVRFTRPTLRVRPGWLVAAGGAGRLPADAHDAAARGALRVAALDGSVELAELRRRGVPEERLIVVPDASSGQAAVAGGKADAFALSWPSVTAMARGSGGRLRALPATDVDGHEDLVALALHRDDIALRDAIDAALASYIGSPEHRRALSEVGLGADDLPRAAARDHD